MSFCISDEELDALYGLPHAAQLMYIVGIRPHMDYATGVVGRRRRISLKGLSESLFVDHVRGSGAHDAPTKSAIRHALSRLLDAGIIVPDGDEPMVFRLPHAKSDFSAQIQHDTRTAHVQHSQHDTQKQLSGAGCEQINDTRTAHVQHSQHDTHPVSDIRNNISTAVVIDSVVGAQNSAAQQAAQPKTENQVASEDNSAKPKKPRAPRVAKIKSGGYQPTEWAIGQLSAQGIGEDCWREVLSRFQHYYSTQTGKTVEQWDCKFLSWAVSDYERQKTKNPAGAGLNRGLSNESGTGYQNSGRYRNGSREDVEARQRYERELVDRRYAGGAAAESERGTVIDGWAD